MNSYQRRNKKDKRLETHLWHAKRMKMQRYFGYKIAQTPNEKSSRACFRYAKHDCLIYDKSYMHLAILEFSHLESIEKLFKNFLL